MYQGYFAERFWVDPFGRKKKVILSVDAKCGSTKVGKVEVNYYTEYKNILDHGADIKALFTPSVDISKKPCCCDDVRWIQVVSTNMPELIRGDKEESYLDPQSKKADKEPYYYDTDKQPSDPSGNNWVESWRTKKGGLKFEDTPYRDARGFKGGEVKWRAVLCLVCVKGSSNTPMACISYGWKATVKDGAKVDPIRETPPEEMDDWQNTLDNHGKKE